MRPLGVQGLDATRRMVLTIEDPRAKSMDSHYEFHRRLAGRIREVRRELYGDSGESTLADHLGLPRRTWRNYESGVILPATVLLRFIAATGADPRWLLTGQGARYMRRMSVRFRRPEGTPHRAGGP
jgi:hypothetical protein